MNKHLPPFRPTNLESLGSLERLAGYFDWLEANGLKIPASKSNPHQPDLKRIAMEARVPRDHLARKKFAERVLLLSKISQIGLEERFEPVAPSHDEIGIADLVPMMIDDLKDQCDILKLSMRQLGNACHAFTELVCRKTGAEMTDPARKPLERIQNLVDTGALGPNELRPEFLSAAFKCLAKGDKLIPDDLDLRQTLQRLLHSRGISIGELARQVDMPEGSLASWVAGRKAPDKSSLPKLVAIENLLELDDGALVRRVRFGRSGSGRIPRTDFPEAYRGKDARGLRIEVSGRIPDTYHFMNEAEKHALVATICNDVIASSKKGKNWYKLRRIDCYAVRYRNWPKRLQQEFDGLNAFKSGDTVLNREGRYVSPRKKWKSSSTLGTMRRRVEWLVGFLTRLAPPHLRKNIEDISLLDLIDLELLTAFLEFKAERQREVYGSPRLTASDMDLVTFAASLVSPVDGYLRFNTAGHDRLIAEYGPDEDTIAVRRKRKSAVTTPMQVDSICNLIHRDIKSFEAAHRGKLDGPDKHHARMDPLLDKDKPLAELYKALDHLSTKAETLQPERFEWARQIRDLVLVHMQLQLGFRARTLVSLVLADDDSSNLVVKDGKYLVRAHKSLFRNGSSSKRFKKNPYFEREIKNVHGAHAILKLYLEKARPILLGWTESPALLVSSAKHPKFDERGLDSQFGNITSRLVGPMADEDYRIKDMLPFPTQGFRDVLATSVLKQLGVWEFVADALYDSIPTVQKHYARWEPSDRAKMLATIMDLAARFDDDDPPPAPKADPSHAEPSSF